MGRCPDTARTLLAPQARLHRAPASGPAAQPEAALLARWRAGA